MTMRIYTIPQAAAITGRRIKDIALAVERDLIDVERFPGCRHLANHVMVLEMSLAAFVVSFPKKKKGGR